MSVSKELDKFYTKDIVAKECVSLIPEELLKNIIEPSAGGGSFLRALSCHNTLVEAYDILPEHNDIIQADWLTDDIGKRYSCTIIGNPPFGNRNVLSKAFITKSIERGADTICFILPLSFRKPTTQKVFPKEWSLLIDYRLDANSFLLEGSDYKVPCTFQVWTKLNIEGYKDTRWKDNEYLEHKDFKFVKDGGDVFVFGAAPKKIINPSDVKPTNRGYQLKLNIDKTQFIDKINSIDWDYFKTSTAGGGVFWLTRQEFVKAYSSLD